MIVRTYGRRNRGIARTYSGGLNDVVEDPYKDSLSQESPHELYGLAFSSQDSSHWSFDSDPYDNNSLPPRDSENGVVRKAKKARNGKRRQLGEAKNSKPIISGPTAIATATLMETQEFGEMMEHADEVNFALDGLRKGQPLRIRRASLLSLLSICGTAQQRRLLRTQGMAKTIIDAVMGLSFDDSPSNLAAATVFFVLTSDSQDDYLLESPSCIRFLLELLKPPMSNATRGKAPSIGIKLLGLRKDIDILRDTNKTIDSSSAAIVRKVQEVLVSCKEMKSSRVDDNGLGRPELSPKWIALLTMEKACFSTISLEDTSGTVRKTGGNFKEKFREFGGLDAVFEVAMNCHSTLEGWLNHGSPSIRDAKDDANLQSLVLLLKCLKIMENAAFLSKDNQSHLLGMKGNRSCHGSQLSFINLILSIVKTLSGLSLSKSSSTISIKGKSCNIFDGISQDSEMDCMADYRGTITPSQVESNGNLLSNHSRMSCSMERTSPEKCFNISQNSRWLSTARPGQTTSSSEAATTSMADACLSKMRVSSSVSGSCNEISRSSIKTPVNSNGSQKSFGFGKISNIFDDSKFEPLEDSQDPFAFDEDDFKPSKWDVLSGKQKVSQTKKGRAPYREIEDGCLSQLRMTQQESSNRENSELHYISRPAETSCSDAVNNENSSLLADCLLNAVKVLMNLTNDNPVGCQQIADCGGLETMSALIADHFPSFSSSSSAFSEMKAISMLSNSNVEPGPQNDTHLTDQELDFLVAILGLLVNLVEKDDHNRTRLAAASVSLPSSEGLEEGTQRDVIPLLCAIFLTNKGAGEAADDLPWNDEAAVLQGEKEAEKMIVESYAALLLAFLSTESKSTRDAIANCLPDHNLRILVPVLDQFLAFHMSLNMLSPETQKTVSEVIESCRLA